MQDLFGSRDLPEGFRYSPLVPAAGARACGRVCRNSAGRSAARIADRVSPRAAIGWHKDRSVFGDVIAISLLAPCIFRMRQKAAPCFDDSRAPTSCAAFRQPSPLFDHFQELGRAITSGRCLTAPQSR
jgi:hypothetical protein